LIEVSVVVLIFAVLRNMLSQSRAAVLAILYAFGTYSWAAATNTLTTVSSGELFITLTLLSLVQVDSWKRSPWWISLGLGALALAVVTRPQLILVGLVIGVSMLWQAVRQRVVRLWHFVIPLAVGSGIAAYNTWAFGSPFNTGYGLEASKGWSTPIGEGLPGLLFSPAHGMLVYSPLLLLGAILGAIALYKQDSVNEYPHRFVGLIALIAAVVQILLISHWWAWHGGHAYNQRMLMEIHPLLVFLGALGVKQFGKKAIQLYTLGTLWVAMIYLARSGFYDLHLEFVQQYKRGIVWSLKDSELVMYVRWHGFGNVVAWVMRQAALCLAVSLGLLLFY
jgi:hypothetical protein